MPKDVQFRALGPTPVERWHEGEFFGEGIPMAYRFGFTMRLALCGVLLMLGVAAVQWFQVAFLGLATALFLYAILFAIVLPIVFIWTEGIRFVTARAVTADARGVHAAGSTLPWDDIIDIHADLVAWRIDDGGDSGGSSRHVEHAVILERLDDRIGFFVRSAERAEALADAMRAMRHEPAEPTVKEVQRSAGRRRRGLEER